MLIDPFWMILPQSYEVVRIRSTRLSSFQIIILHRVKVNDDHMAVFLDTRLMASLILRVDDLIKVTLWLSYNCCGKKSKSRQMELIGVGRKLLSWVIMHTKSQIYSCSAVFDTLQSNPIAVHKRLRVWCNVRASGCPPKVAHVDIKSLMRLPRCQMEGNVHTQNIASSDDYIYIVQCSKYDRFYFLLQVFRSLSRISESIVDAVAIPTSF